MTVFGDWLLDRYSDHVPEIDGFDEDEKEIFKRAAVAYLTGADFSDVLATQSSDEYIRTLRLQIEENDEFLQETPEQSAQTDGALAILARRGRGKPVQERDRRLIRAVAQEWRKRDREVQLPASDAMADNVDRPTDFSCTCERYIRIIDPSRKQMPKRNAYRGAIPPI